MDQEPDLNNENLEDIRQQMDATRASLSQKIETLEEEVRETVVGARETVEDTIDSVRSTVEDTVETVKRTFDVEYQVNRHPWAMLGASVLAGFVAGRLVTGREHRRNVASPSTGAYNGAGPRSDFSSTAAASDRRQTESERPNWLANLVHQFDDEIGQLKGVAVGALAGVARDLIVNAAPPSLARQLGDVMDNVTSKLGGKPVSGRVV